MTNHSQLSLRQFTLGDARFVIELLNSKGWLTYIGDKQVRQLSEAKDYIINGPLKAYEHPVLGLKVISYSLNDREPKIPVGVCGLLKRDYLDFPDIGYALLPEYEGRGFVHWAINQVIDDLLIRKSIPILYAITKPENERSRKVLIRNDFEFVDERMTDRGLIYLYQRIL